MIGFISEKLLIPILDFFYGLVPSYGLAIVALTVVIRIALFPLSAGSIRSARRMKIAQPVMQKRQAEIKSKFSGDPKKQQEELGKLMNEFGSPLAGCLPLIVQMPVLFALFATLRGLLMLQIVQKERAFVQSMEGNLLGDYQTHSLVFQVLLAVFLDHLKT